MSVVIRLQRTGKPKQAHFRLVAIERGQGSTGKPLEVLGNYNPRGETPGKKLAVRRERYDAWLKNGARPSDTVVSLIRAAAKGIAPEEKKP